MNKTAKRFATILVVAIVLVLLALPKLKTLWAEDKKGPNGGAPGAAAGSQPTEVSGIVVSADTIAQDLIVAGNVLADEQVDLRPEVSGRVVKINFKEGGRVSKGQLLVKLNDADLQAQLSRYLSERKVSEAKLGRTKQLLEKEAVSKEEYEAMENDVNAARANIQNLQAQIAKTAIYAPFDGTIGLRMVSEGSYVSPQTTISSITKLTPVKIDFAVPERYADRVRPGAKVRFNIQGETQAYSADVYALEPRINEATRSLQVRARYPNIRNELLPGAYAQVQLSVGKDRSAIMIPSEALVPNAGGAEVYLYKNGAAQPQKVETGIRTDTQIQITEGLQPGDSVITSGIIQLHPGSKVNFNLKEE